MKTISIKHKLENIGVPLDSVIRGDFDRIGEFTAKRERSPYDENYKKYGAFYRSNYERGILIYHLIRQYGFSSMLEIGFGRGYATLCAAKAFYDSGIEGKIVSIDPNVDQQYVSNLQRIFPGEWFKSITLMKGTSGAVLPSLNEKFDFVYIDGDHSYEGTKLDWDCTKDKCTKAMLFDDYHLPTKDDPGIQCRTAIDEIDWVTHEFHEPELIIQDRRIFFDDRQVPDDKVDYGQVLFTKLNCELRNLNDW
jgi:predicted O-methyltransferase YrrM